MNKKVNKKLIWIFGILAIIGLLIWFLLMTFLRSVGEKCEENRTWKIENYKIVEKRCLGFAGPYHYPIYLYENGKEIAFITFWEESKCVIEFKTYSEKILSFDICEKQIK
jgi:hypothetical protein